MVARVRHRTQRPHCSRESGRVRCSRRVGDPFSARRVLPVASYHRAHQSGHHHRNRTGRAGEFADQTDRPALRGARQRLGTRPKPLHTTPTRSAMVEDGSESLLRSMPPRTPKIVRRPFRFNCLKNGASTPANSSRTRSRVVGAPRSLPV